MGLLTARALALAGHEVQLFERGVLGHEASFAAGGILSPLHPWRYPEAVTDLARASQEVYPGLCHHLSLATRTDPEWTRSGLLRLGEAEAHEACVWASRFGVELELCDSGDVFPEHGLKGQAVWMPSVAQVRSPRLLRALVEELMSLSVGLHEHATIEGVVRRGEELRGVVVNGEEVSATRVVMAAGPWTGPFLSRYGLPLDIAPMRGQMIVVQGPPGLLPVMILDEARYLVPRRDGAILVGSTMEDVGFQKEVTDEARNDLMQAAYNLLPELRRYPVTHQWAGLRPSSPQGVPFIGEHPEIRGLFVNSGHFRNGIVLGPASAALAADLVLGRDPAVDPSAYALDRSLGAPLPGPVLP